MRSRKRSGRGPPGPRAASKTTNDANTDLLGQSRRGVKPLVARRRNVAADAIAACIDEHPEYLSGWEKRFLLSLSGFCRLSHRQRLVLTGIIAKLRRAREAGNALA